MKIWNLRITKKKIAALLGAAAALGVGLVILLGGKEKPSEERCLLESNEQRVEYLAQWGWEVAAEPVETLQLLFGETLNEPYLSYNVLQKAQGFDLELCLGKALSRYTYAVTNYPGGRQGVQVNLYICEGQPVAGDVFASGADGFRNPLLYPGRESPQNAQKNSRS